MKTRIALLTILLAGIVSLEADPRFASWFTDHSGAYARIYETVADETAGNSVTTWSRGQGVQSLPTYAGVNEVSYTDDWVYIRTTGLGSHIMGPWYLNAAKTNLFPNYPANRAVLYRIPRAPTVPGPKTLTGLGAIGYFVDGVAMFDSRDAFSYSNSNAADATPQTAFSGDGIWNRDAFVNESVTFDAGNAHQAGSNYHYHANPPALRHQLGDSVDYNDVTNVYTENFDGGHSPILGWARDGFPIYGPYGYDDPNVADSATVRRMISGYQMRDGTNGTTDLPTTGRTTLPAWGVVAQGIGPALAANQFGPAVGAGFPLGHYIEDYDYLGDQGQSQGTDFDLDQYNGRTCLTPEFPGGTYAYFVSIESDGTPHFPYNIGRWFNGDPTGNTVGTIPAAGDAGTLTKYFEGGPEKQISMKSASVDDPASDDVTVMIDAIEGGTYNILESGDLGAADPWTALAPPVTADSDTAGIIHTGIAGTSDRHYYLAEQTALADFDDTGFDWPGGGGGPSVTFTATFPTAPPLPPQNAVNSITVGGVVATIVSYDQGTGVVELNFDDSSLAPGSYDAILNFSPGGTPTDVFSTNQYVVSAPSTNNILLIIVDDWGIDRSPIDNTVPPAGVLPNMPNLQTLASQGLRFTRAYVNPTCSPTRASIMTGRYAHQTGVYTPQNAGAFSTAETALPEAMTAAGSNYEMASMGKWHLGGNTGAYSARGGWDEFYGIQGGGVQDYFSWTKNTNGTNSASTTYTTTDQVNEAIAFINRSENPADPKPWFCWVAFNAPHTPFHEPPASLEPLTGGGYTNVGQTDNQSLYTRMLEALDTELGRLLAAVDPIDTNVILVGDNGTPNQVVQAPFGNGNSKGDLYNGGIHVPMVFKGPAFTGTPGTTTDKLVHAVDFYTSILELAGINPSTVAPPTALAQSTSFVPILNGTDTADRCMIAEGGAGAARGRAIIVDDHPTYKMIIFGDPESTLDTPTIEFYANITTTDQNEQTPLYSGPVTATPPLTGADLTAYTACYNKDQTLGGGYSDPPAPSDTIYIQVVDTNGPTQPNVPQLVNGQGNPINPSSIVVDGVDVTGGYVARVNSGASLADEADDVADRFWVKVNVPINPPYTNATITFTIQGNDRVFTNNGTPILVKP